MNGKVLSGVIERGATGIAGLALAVSPFLVWATAESGDLTGWELTSAVSLLAVLAGVTAVVAAATGGQIGLFRPDVSFVGAADMFAVATAAAMGAVVLLDVPSGTSAGAGAYVGLGSAIVIFSFCGDYRVLRGAPAFPRLTHSISSSRRNGA